MDPEKTGLLAANAGLDTKKTITPDWIAATTGNPCARSLLEAFSGTCNPRQSKMSYTSITGVGKCPFLGMLNITFKYLLEIVFPIVG